MQRKSKKIKYIPFFLFGIVFLCILLIKTLSVELTLLSESTVPESDTQALCCYAVENGTWKGNDICLNGSESRLYLYTEYAKDIQKYYNGRITFETEIPDNAIERISYTNEIYDFYDDHESNYFISTDRHTVIFTLPNEPVKAIRIEIQTKDSTSLYIKEAFFSNRTLQNGYNILKTSGFFYVTLLIWILLCIAWKYLCDVIYNFIVKLFLLVNQMCKQHFNIMYVLTLLFASLVVYYQYVLGDRIFVFADGAKDSLWQTYPNLLYWADRIKRGEWNSTFSFYDGFGMPKEAIRINLTNWVCLWGREHVGYLMGISQWLKVFFSGVFAYLFAKMNKKQNVVCAIVGLGYAFCAHMIIRNDFESYPNVVLIVIVWLAVYEYIYQKNKLLVLPIVTVFAITSMGSLYYMLLWTLIFAVYIVFRWISDNIDMKVSWKQMFVHILVFGCSSFLVFGTSIFNSLKEIMTSTRFSTASSTVSQQGNTTADILQNNTVQAGYFTQRLFGIKEDIVSAFLRTVGMSINGVAGDHFTGSSSYLNDGAFYCGILILLMIPAAIYNMQKKKRICYILSYVIVCVYICCKPLRLLVNGYGSEGFKLSSFWIILLMLLTFVDIMEQIFKQHELRAKTELVILTTAGLIETTLIYALLSGHVSRHGDLWISFSFVILYSFIIIRMISKKIDFEKFGNLILFVVAVEVVLVSWNYTNDRDTLKKDSSKEENIYYSDSTMDALEIIQREDNDWFRVEKQYGMEFNCAPLAEGYYGTTTYIGGLGIGEDVLELCNTYGLIKRGTDLLYGTGGNIYNSSLLGVKYVLTKDTSMRLYGFSYWKTVGDVNIYKNELALPVAYAYDAVIDKSDFLELSIPDRNRSVLKACVVENDTDAFGKVPTLNKVSKMDIVSNEEFLNTDRNRMLLIKTQLQGNDGVYIETVDMEDRGIRSAVLPQNGAWTETELYGTVKELTGFRYCYPSAEIPLEGISVEVYSADANDYYKDTISDISKLQKNGLQVTRFDDACVEGTINVDHNGILATSIPYSYGWHIFIDGKEAVIEKVNVGFIGTEILQGEHNISIKYLPNGTYIEQSKGAMKRWLATFALVALIGAISKIEQIIHYEREH